MKKLYDYNNGNYNVKIFDDGTKIRETQEDKFLPDFSENIDIKITDYCLAGCKFCHEQSTGLGQHGNLNVGYLETLQKGTELAQGGGNAARPRIGRGAGAGKRRQAGGRVGDRWR